MRRAEKALPLVIGIGNAYRHDDAVGLFVARSLKIFFPQQIRVLEMSGEGVELLEAWKESEKVILIDAVSSGAEAGIIHRLDAHQQSIPSDFFHYSTHTFSVAEAVEMTRALGQLPSQLIVYGIEGEDFSFGEGLSPKVQKAVEQVREKILQELCLQEPSKIE